MRASYNTITSGPGSAAAGSGDDLRPDAASGSTRQAAGRPLDEIQDGMDQMDLRESHSPAAAMIFAGARPAESTRLARPAAARSTATDEASSQGPGSLGFDASATFTEINAGKKPSWMSSKDWDQMQLQQEMQDYMKMVNLLTNLMKMQHEATMAIVRNISA